MRKYHAPFNFLKHGERDANKSRTFDPDEVEATILVATILLVELDKDQLTTALMIVWVRSDFYLAADREAGGFGDLDARKLPREKVGTAILNIEKHADVRASIWEDVRAMLARRDASTETPSR